MCIEVQLTFGNAGRGVVLDQFGNEMIDHPGTHSMEGVGWEIRSQLKLLIKTP